MTHSISWQYNDWEDPLSRGLAEQTLSESPGDLHLMSQSISLSLFSLSVLCLVCSIFFQRAAGCSSSSFMFPILHSLKRHLIGPSRYCGIPYLCHGIALPRYTVYQP